MESNKIDTIIIDGTTEDGKRVKNIKLDQIRKNNGIPVMIINQKIEDFISTDNKSIIESNPGSDTTI